MSFVHFLTGSDSITVRPERTLSLSKGKSKARKPAKMALFDFAVHTATLRANWQKHTSTR